MLVKAEFARPLGALELSPLMPVVGLLLQGGQTEW